MPVSITTGPGTVGGNLPDTGGTHKCSKRLSCPMPRVRSCISRTATPGQSAGTAHRTKTGSLIPVLSYDKTSCLIYAGFLQKNTIIYLPTTHMGGQAKPPRKSLFALSMSA